MSRGRVRIVPAPDQLRNPSGLCKCGCKQPAPLAPYTWVAKGMFRGYPLDYITGHNTPRLPRQWLDDAMPFKIDGVYCRLVPLTQGMWAIVDERRYAEVRWFDWNAHWDPTIRAFYAVRSWKEHGKTRKQSMHNFILNPPTGKFADHIDVLATLDNREANLQPADHSESGAHRRLRRDNKTGLKGVHKRSNRTALWNWQVKFKGEVRRGSAKSPELAHEAYCKAATELHGKFVQLV
jgi:hypothetical protein